jgi:hypothetical protein
MSVAKKTQSVFNLPTAEELDYEVSAIYAQTMRSGAVTPQELRLQAEVNLRLQVMRGYELKLHALAHGMETIHKQVSIEVHALAVSFDGINQAARGKAYEPYVTQYNHHNAELAGKHMATVTEIAMQMLGGETMRPLEIPEAPKVVEVIVEKRVVVPQRRRGFWERMESFFKD